MLIALSTFDELGYHNAQINGWYGLYAPAKTPKEYTDRFVAEVVKALKDPTVVERMRNLGAEPVAMPQGEFARYLVADIDKYAKLGKRINLKLE